MRWIGDLSRVFLRGVGLEPQRHHPAPAVHVLPGHVLHHHRGADLRRHRRADAVLRLRHLHHVWALVVYAPIAHWVWGGGWLAKMGALDFAGGTVVHVNAGVAALVAALVVGKRARLSLVVAAAAQRAVHAARRRPAVVRLVRLQRRERRWRRTRIAALAFTTTMLAPAGTLVVVDAPRRRPDAASRRPWASATAIVVGLVAVTPAAGFIGPMSAIALGAIAAVPSYFCARLRAKTSLDDSLDVVAAHGVGGTVGALLTGVFAQKALNGVADGALFGNPGQIVIQAIAVLRHDGLQRRHELRAAEADWRGDAAARNGERRERRPGSQPARRRGLRARGRLRDVGG